MILGLLVLLSSAYGQDTPDDLQAETDSAEIAEAPAPAEVLPSVVPPASTTAPDATAVQLVLVAAREGKWGLVLASTLMFVVYFVRTYIWKSLPPSALPYVTIGLSSATAFSAAVLTGAPMTDAVLVALGGLFAGLSAVGFWETLGKKLFKKPSPQ